LTGAPGARDGARTTHNSFDETHRMTSPRLMKAHTTMMQNTYKRQMADAWSLETTTMYDPTEMSVAKDTHEYAQEVADGKLEDSRLFYFYRYAPEESPLGTIDEVRSALEEASGPAVAWSGDIDGLAKHWFEPNTDKEYFRRVWLNQKVAGGGKAFDSVAWAANVDATHVVPDRARIALGFDGAKSQDGTAIVACELRTGFMWLAGYWQSDGSDPEWEVDPDEVEQVLEQLFDRYKVERLYADPFYWTTELKGWAGRWGEKRVLEYSTTLYKRIGLACASFAGAIKGGQVKNDGGSKLAEHIGNAVRQDTNLRGDDDVPLWTISKERRGGPLKIDAAMAAILAWQAANDSIAKGALKKSSGVASFN
jgi:phage terminase large subunit-like protein